MSDPKNFRPYPRTIGRGPFTVEASGFEPVKGETIPRRHPAAKDKLITTPSEDVKTIFDILKRSADRFGNAKAMGSRKLLKMHHETKKVKKMVDGKEQEVDKKWSYYEMSGYSFISFVEYEKMALQAGYGLRKMGLVKDDRLHLFASTTPQWLAMSHGAASQSIPVATAYDTLGEEGLKHSLIQTKAKAIYCDPSLLKVLLRPLESATDIQLVVYNSDAELNKEDIDKLKSKFTKLQVLSFEELRQLGESNPVETVPPGPEDLCCIMYTSGSTGVPKGCPIKHKSVLAAIAGVTTIIGQYLGPGDKMLTYLPLAHILEYVFENACLFWGSTMGYGSPKTISDLSMRNCAGDLREFKPTIMVGVPAVWESVKKGVMGKVNAGSPLLRSVFWSALSLKTFLIESGLPGAGVLDALIFKKVKEATGGQLRVVMSGGGPIAKDTQRFISMAITPMIGGYGLTETCAMGALMDPMHWTDNAVGDIPSSIEIKLVDFPDAGYFSSSTPPQGEVWIRGAPVMGGYYENEDETKEALTSDGWFRSGDIGEFDKMGQLRIIDRIKNLVKTLNGEYIALEKLESTYRSNPVVANILVYADGNRTKPVAVIVPAEPALKKVAQENGIEGNGLEDLCHNKQLNGLVLKQILATGREGGLHGAEMLDGIVMADEEWSPANGMTTAAQKINRKAILNKFHDDIEKIYSGK